MNRKKFRLWFAAGMILSFLQAALLMGTTISADGQEDRRIDDRGGHRGGVGRDIGVGIGVGIVRELMTTPAGESGGSTTHTTKRARKDVSHSSTRAAKKAGKDDKDGGKGGKGGNAKKPEPPPAITGVKPNPDDPAGGLTVDGGTVHRGTGDYGDRKAIVCWVNPAADAKCKDFEWYQFYCAEITIDAGDGKGPQDMTKQATGKGSVLASSGGYLKFGEWGADEYTDTKGKKRKLPIADGVPCPAPKETLKGGAYSGPFDIEGLPKIDKSQKSERLKRLADAPSAESAVDDIMTKMLGQPHHINHDNDKPKDSPPFEMVVTYHFRTALYCDQKCLGYFDYTFKETIKVTRTWADVADQADKTLGQASWKSGFVGKTQKREGPVMGKFMDCPPADNK